MGNLDRDHGPTLADNEGDLSGEPFLDKYPAITIKLDLAHVVFEVLRFETDGAWLDRRQIELTDRDELARGWFSGHAWTFRGSRHGLGKQQRRSMSHIEAR